MGSKNKLANKILALFPKRSHFVDLFCGGCAITHAAMLSNKYEKFIANDIDGCMPQLFMDAAAGKYRDECRWISREDFKRLKDFDPYVALVWSFGNNKRNYLYSKDIEPWKRALHHVRVFKDTSMFLDMGIDTDGSRADIVKHKEEYREKYIKWLLAKQDYSAEELDALIARCKNDIAMQEDELRQYLLDGLKSSGLTQAEVFRRLKIKTQIHCFWKSQLSFQTEKHYTMMRTFMPMLDMDYNEVVGLHNLSQSLERLQSLESLQRLQSLESLQSLQSLQRLQSLESLQSLQSLQRLQLYSKDYTEVDIPNDSVIYCDIPYKGTSQYACGKFDHERFYDWACIQKEPVFVSSYEMPMDRFDCVAEFRRRNLMCKTKISSVVERIFVPKGSYIEE